jgi:hypothetical protein
VHDGNLAYITKIGENYEPFQYQCTVNSTDIEISDDVFIITQETAENYKKLLADRDNQTKEISSQSDTEKVANNPHIEVKDKTPTLVQEKTLP